MILMGKNGHIWRKICPRPTLSHANSTWIGLWVQTQASASVELYRWENWHRCRKVCLGAILSHADSTRILLGSNPGLCIEGLLNTHVSCHVAAWTDSYCFGIEGYILVIVLNVQKLTIRDTGPHSNVVPLISECLCSTVTCMYHCVPALPFLTSFRLLKVHVLGRMVVGFIRMCLQSAWGVPC